MLDSVLRYFQDRTALQLARDALDVLIVYYVFYRALLVLRGTRAMQVGVGLGVVFLLYFVAQTLQLVTVLSVLGSLISSIILVIVVVFQNDIRRGLQRVGSRALFGGLTRTREGIVFDEVVEAATELARHRIGAIITFEQEANLDEFVGQHKGHVLDAAISSELLVSLFVPEGVNRLHDGAVIIRNYRIAKAGVFFPMPEARMADESFGSRHRAAMGITEETDAVVVVVSEERGTISFCFNGNIASNLDGPKLRAMLEAIFSPKLARKKKQQKSAPRDTRRGERDAEPASQSAVLSDRPRVSIVPRSEQSEAEDGPSLVMPREESSRQSTPDRDSSQDDRPSEPPEPLRPRVTLVNEESITAKAPRATPLREESITSKAPRATPLREESITAKAPAPLRESALRTPVSGRSEMVRTPLPRKAQDSQDDDDDDKPRDSGGRS
jgi:diadenylate cyclase